jgi:hypothetical protein
LYRRVLDSTQIELIEGKIITKVPIELSDFGCDLSPSNDDLDDEITPSSQTVLLVIRGALEVSNGELRNSPIFKLREVTFDRQKSVALSVRTSRLIITQEPLRFCSTELLNVVPRNKSCCKHCWSQAVTIPGTRQQVYKPFR